MTTKHPDQFAEFRREMQRRREALGWTAQRAAKETAGRLSAPRWRYLERGLEVRKGVEIEANPRRDTVIAIAEALGWPIAVALESAGFDPGGHADVDILEDDDRVPGFAQLTDDQRAAVVELVTSILRSQAPDQAAPGGSFSRAVPLRTGRAPDDLLSRPDVKVRTGDPRADDQASADR